MDIKEMYENWIAELGIEPLDYQYNKGVDMLYVSFKPRLKIFSKIPASIMIFGHLFINKLCYKIIETKKLINVYPTSMDITQNDSQNDTAIINFNCDKIKNEK